MLTEQQKLECVNMEFNSLIINLKRSMIQVNKSDYDASIHNLRNWILSDKNYDDFEQEAIEIWGGRFNHE